MRGARQLVNALRVNFTARGRSDTMGSKIWQFQVLQPYVSRLACASSHDPRVFLARPALGTRSAAVAAAAGGTASNR